METDMDFMKERYELCTERIREIVLEQEVPEKYRDYFKSEAEFILSTVEMAKLVEEGTYAKQSLEELEAWNERLFVKIVPAKYETSYANPAYAVKKFGVREGKLLCALSAKFQELVGYAAEHNLYFQTISVLLQLVL